MHLVLQGKRMAVVPPVRLTSTVVDYQFDEDAAALAHRVIDNQVRDLSKQQAIGAYNIAKYHAPKTLPCPTDASRRLTAVSTRVWHMDRCTQERLINWGYAIADAALLIWPDPAVSAPAEFPFPEAGVA